MERKFLKLIENTIERYSNGGLLTGDLVKLTNTIRNKGFSGIYFNLLA